MRLEIRYRATFEGVARKHMLVRGGERRDSAWYAVIDDDWPHVKADLERQLGWTDLCLRGTCPGI